MRGIYMNKQSIIILFISLLILSGCAGSRTNIGKTIDKSLIIPLDQENTAVQDWQQDIVIEYYVNKVGNSNMLDGKVSITDSRMYLYPVPDFFFLSVNFVDDNGSVISSHEISPLMTSSLSIKNSYKLRVPLPVPDNASGIAFNYWGNFREEGFNKFRGVTGGWEIYYNPFI